MAVLTKALGLDVVRWIHALVLGDIVAVDVGIVFQQAFAFFEAVVEGVTDVAEKLLVGEDVVVDYVAIGVVGSGDAIASYVYEAVRIEIQLFEVPCVGLFGCV